MRNSSFLVENLICHLLGNISLWIYHLGKKPYDEIVKKDNSKIGLIVGIVILVVIFISFKSEILNE